MGRTILTNKQKNFLEVFGQDSTLKRMFYLSGGTALSEFYLQHRFSEDLDFFSFNEFDPNNISLWLARNKRILGHTSFEYQQSFNRNLFFLHFANEKLKIEFTYYPFVQIKKPIVMKNLNIYVDSIEDIAANKLFTIYQKPRGRDYFDLFEILRKNHILTIDSILKDARIKFDTHIDKLQLASQFFVGSESIDDPILLDITIRKDEVIDFFVRESDTLKKDIVTR